MNQMNPDVFAQRRQVSVDPQIMSQFKNYLRVSSGDLIKCSAWLGGTNWGLRTARLVTALSNKASFSREHVQELRALHRFLRLDLVEDYDSPEAARFAELNLHDARVERCCKHCEVIGDFITAMDGAAAEAPAAAA